ncbi:Protein of unknown function (DUF2608) [Chlamydia poikilotherma]|uniref:Uncharacterized protein n=1 Tax=Chlamydia poikilotherma TaxID=1967783 RepID=A0A3B0PM31_9CHLA|nr:DUF2608 domain-containing protein [Chlamydia poikilotherma]SYX08789.1 Protein of unknown function (DUF2608) [Chlamydia poikilotherma]
MKIVFFITFFFSIFSLEASIIKVSDVQAINKYAKKGSLVLLALDETVVFPKQMLGTTAWFQERLEKLKKEESDFDPIEKVFGEKVAVSFAIDYELIHPEVPKAIAALSLSEAWVMGVSQLSIPIASHFLRSAVALGLGFSACLPARSDGWMQHLKTFGRPEHAMFIEDQVLFTGGLINTITMEEVLSTLFATLETLPQQVIYLDANKDNLISAEAACKQANVYFIGMHYSPAVKRIKEYKSDIANLQWLQLHNQLSDKYFQALLTYVIGPEGQG